MRYFAEELKFLQKNSEGSLLLPGGVSVNNVFICGALTELKKSQNNLIINARIADPTGVFQIYCGKDRAYCSSVLAGLNIPVFLIVYGKITTSKQNGSVEIHILPEYVHEISREERDLWILGTSAATINRLENYPEGCDGDYGRKVSLIVEKALMTVNTADSCEMSCGDDILKNAGERIMELIAGNSTKRGILLDDLYLLCEGAGITKDAAQKCLNELIEDDELYLPSGGYVKIL